MVSQALQIDVRTVILIYFWCSVFILVFILGYYFSYGSNENRKTLKWFALSRLLFTANQIFNLWNGLEPNIIIAILSECLVLGGAYFESIVIFQLLDFVPRKFYRLQLYITLILLVMTTLVLLLGLGFREQILMGSLEISAILLIPIFRFVMEKRHNFFCIIFASVYVAYCISIAARAIHICLNPEPAIIKLDEFDIVFFLSAFLLLITSIVGFLLLIKEKQERYLRKLLSDKNQFISIISHDLRAPMNSAMLISGILNKKFDQFNPEKVQNYLQIINEGSKNNIKLLENLVNWSKVQNGLMEFNPERLALEVLIQENLHDQKQLAFDKNISMDFYCKESIEMLIDKNMMETVLRNLITNAVKFNRSNGSVKIIALKNDQHVEISVEDTGMGMSEPTKNRLFKIDDRMSKSGSEREVETGLGLLLCDEFIKRHNGKIWVESQVGKGSVFKVVLPLN